MCSGYYSYKRGYEPEFNGRSRFKGTIVHPQEWPENLDCTDKRVVVIGSGATAMTLVPAMASTVEHITLLQRSPTYVVSRPAIDPFAKKMRRYLPSKFAHRVTRFKNTTMQQIVYKKSRTKPDELKKLLLGGVRAELGPDYDVDKHFTPS